MSASLATLQLAAEQYRREHGATHFAPALIALDQALNELRTAGLSPGMEAAEAAAFSMTGQGPGQGDEPLRAQPGSHDRAKGSHSFGQGLATAQEGGH